MRSVVKCLLILGHGYWCRRSLLFGFAALSVLSHANNCHIALRYLMLCESNFENSTRSSGILLALSHLALSATATRTHTHTETHHYMCQRKQTRHATEKSRGRTSYLYIYKDVVYLSLPPPLASVPQVPSRESCGSGMEDRKCKTSLAFYPDASFFSVTLRKWQWPRSRRGTKQNEKENGYTPMDAPNVDFRELKSRFREVRKKKKSPNPKQHPMQSHPTPTIAFQAPRPYWPVVG